MVTKSRLFLTVIIWVIAGCEIRNECWEMIQNYDHQFAVGSNQIAWPTDCPISLPWVQWAKQSVARSDRPTVCIPGGPLIGHKLESGWQGRTHDLDGRSSLQTSYHCSNYSTHEFSLCLTWITNSIDKLSLSFPTVIIRFRTHHNLYCCQASINVICFRAVECKQSIIIYMIPN